MLKHFIYSMVTIQLSPIDVRTNYILCLKKQMPSLWARRHMIILYITLLITSIYMMIIIIISLVGCGHNLQEGVETRLFIMYDPNAQVIRAWYILCIVM